MSCKVMMLWLKLFVRFVTASGVGKPVGLDVTGRTGGEHYPQCGFRAVLTFFVADSFC